MDKRALLIDSINASLLRISSRIEGQAIKSADESDLRRILDELVGVDSLTSEIRADFIEEKRNASEMKF